MKYREILIQVYQELMEIKTSGKDTCRMADCLRVIAKLIDNMEGEKSND